MSDEESDVETAERRAHHNALERKRRDHIKDKFNSLKEAIPTLRNEKSQASRAQILKQAAEYITRMKHRHESFTNEIETLKRQNALLEIQCRQIESQK